MPMNIVGKFPKVEISSRKPSIVLLNHSRVRSAMASASGIAQRMASRFASVRGSLTPPLSTHLLDDFLSKLAQTDAVERQGWVLLCDAEDIALGRIGIHAEEQVRRGKMEEAQCVGLRDLGESEDSAQLVGRRRDFHREQRVAGFGGGDQMAYRADTADARHQ